MYEDEDVMDPTAAASELSRLSQQYGALGQQEAAARQAYERTRAERLRAAEERIRAARFGMPSSSEQLFALSSAFLSPKRYRGFAGTLNNIVPTLGSLATAKRESESAREQAMLKLRDQYAPSGDEELQRIQDERKNLLDLMKIYGPMAKPQKPNTGFNPLSGRLTDMATGEVITPVSELIARIPPEAINTLRTYVANPAAAPESKKQAMANFERQFGVPGNAVLGGK